MPLPLLMIGIGVGVGAVGVAGNLIAARRMSKDRKRYDCRRSRYEARHEGYKSFVRDINADIWNLHLQRCAALETLHEAANFLVRANIKDRTWNAASRVTPEQFAELEAAVTSVRNIAASATGAAVVGVAAGTTAATGAYAAAAAFGTASTGTAISGLSGIAARNATLAWLGGGSLASGGGGIAAGAATLANVALAPLALLPALVMAIRARNQSKKIDEEIAKMDISEAEMNRHKAKLEVVQSRAGEVSKVVGELDQALKDILELASLDKLEDVYRIYLSAKALSKLLDLDSVPK